MLLLLILLPLGLLLLLLLLVSPFAAVDIERGNASEVWLGLWSELDAALLDIADNWFVSCSMDVFEKEHSLPATLLM